MSASPNRSLVRRVLGRGRRVTRRAIFGEQAAANQDRVDELWHWVNGLQQLVNQTVQRTDTAATEAGEHQDLVVDQLWRRLEAADARLASHLQALEYGLGRKVADLQDLTARLKTENAAILRLIGHEEMVAPEAPVANSLPIAHMTLFSEVERGSSDVLLEKLKQYVPYFSDAEGPVIDLGCGKGDFLQLCADAGIEAYGVDLDHDAVEMATARGLDARLEDLFKHLEALEENSLGGAFSSQVVEHLPASALATLYEELYRVVKPGGRVIVETPNPATFATHVQSFWRDPTHIRPVPMPALDFVARSAGFVSEQTIYASPSADSDRLQPIEFEPQDPLLADFAARFNANVENLNSLLFGYQGYALVVRKP